MQRDKCSTNRPLHQMPSVNTASCSLAVTPSVLGTKSQMENISSKRYMLLPCLIIASMIMWNDKQLERIFRYFCHYLWATKRGCSFRGKFCCEFILYVLQATVSGFLWCTSVLVDGDCYLCCGSLEEVMTVNKKTNQTVHNERCLLLIYLPGYGVNLFNIHFCSAVDEVVRREKSLQGSVWREHTGPDRGYFAEGDEEHGCRCCEKIPDPSDKNANWKKISSLIDVLSESIPKELANNNNNNSNTLWISIKQTYEWKLNVNNYKRTHINTPHV